MKKLAGCWLILIASLAAGQDFPLDGRYGFEVDLKDFPQKTPQDTLRSIVKAWDVQRFDYLLAHLADPGFIDARVEVYKRNYPNGPDQARALLAFEKVVAEIRAHFMADAALIAELRRFSKEGDWDVAEETAVGTHPLLADRYVFMRKINDRWFMENHQSRKR
jgi:hypothetical protein